MKLMIMGDAHLRGGKPDNRLDDYEETQYQKMVWIFEKAKEFDCKYILQPGDLTEHFPYPKMNFECLGKYIDLFFKSEIPLMTILGQHDGSFHKASDNTPIFVMKKAGAIRLDPLLILEECIGDYVCIHGCNFGDEIPTVKYKESFNILLIHKMISNQDYWNGYVQYDSPEWMLNKYPDFSLIVAGDNHHSFHYLHPKENRGLINCGSIMRSNIGQIHHKPCVWVFETNPFTLWQHYIPTKPFNEVFDLTKKEEGKQISIENEALIERLEKGFDSSGIDFVKNYIKAMEPEETGVQSIMKESMNG